MMTKEKDHKNMVNEPQEVTRASYKKPLLLNLGKLTSLTMGSQPGIGESGQAGNRRNPQ